MQVLKEYVSDTIVTTCVSLKIQIYWRVMPCRLVKLLPTFRRRYNP